MEKLKAVLKNKYFCLAWLIFGFLYVTVYGFLKNPFEFTASMIGLDYPWLFKFWGIFACVSLTLNITYMYRKHDFKSKAGIVCIILATCCILTTVNIPSTEIMSLQLVAHWSTALLFAIFYAVAIGLLLLKKSKEDKRFKVLLGLFVGMLGLMVLLLVLFNKNGVIESIPMWGAYIIIFLVNYTKLFDEKKPAEKTIEREKVKK